MVPLRNARERGFSLGKKLSLCQTYLRVPLCTHMHVSFTKMPDLSYTICIFEGAL